MGKLLLALAALGVLAFVVFGLASGRRSDGAAAGLWQDRISASLGRLVAAPIDPAAIRIDRGPCLGEQASVTVSSQSECRLTIPASGDRLRRGVLRVERGLVRIEVLGTEYGGPRKDVAPGDGYALNVEREGAQLRLACASTEPCRLAVEGPA